MACVRCESEPPRTVCHLCLEPSGGFKHDPAMDAVVSAATVECSNSSCRSLVVYHKARDHEIACPFAACACPEPDCNFALPPAELVIHLAEVHSIEVHKLPPYDTTKVFHDVPVPHEGSPCRRLIAQGEDGAVFVLIICAKGQTPIVSIVCVRAKACVWPLYMVSMWADRQSTSSADRPSRTESVTVLLEASSSTVPGKVALEDLSSYLLVPPGYRSFHVFGEETVTLHLSIRIRKENDPHKGTIAD